MEVEFSDRKKEAGYAAWSYLGQDSAVCPAGGGHRYSGPAVQCGGHRGDPVLRQAADFHF